MKVFTSLTEAFRQGYQKYEATPTGYLLRVLTERGWALALYVDSAARTVPAVLD